MKVTGQIPSKATHRPMLIVKKPTKIHQRSVETPKRGYGKGERERVMLGRFAIGLQSLATAPSWPPGSTL